MEEKNPKKILIIEDEEGLALSLATLLRSQGYSIIIAQDSLYGTSLAHNENVDLVILDLGIPGGGGFFVLNNLKQSVFTSHIPVIILTAKQEKELEDRAYKMGVVAYLHKPFEPDDLLGRLKDILYPK